MKTLPRAVSKLIDAFDGLPGIGPKTAARLAFYLLHVPQSQLDMFADSLSNLKRHTVQCSICSNIGETDPCSICSNAERKKDTICIVEQPLDVMVFEGMGKYDGVYHVLHGAISPLNNIGPDDIFIAQLMTRLSNNSVKEIILATNPTIEGEATALYIKEALRQKGLTIPLTRLAHGLPVGGDLEYADELTLSRALEGRREY